LGVIVAVPIAVVIKTALAAVRVRGAKNETALPTTEVISNASQVTVEVTEPEKDLRNAPPLPTVEVKQKKSVDNLPSEGLGARS
jgi:hypothetical protein